MAVTLLTWCSAMWVLAVYVMAHSLRTSWAARVPTRALGATNPFNNTLYLHIHIPKTGGTTFKYELPKLFNKLTYCELDYQHDYGLHFKDIIKEIDFTTCNFFSYEAGHWMMDYIPRQLEVKTLALFRNPVELRISGLEQAARLHRENPHVLLRRFQQGKNYYGYHLQDYQTQCLVCGTDRNTINRFKPCNYDIWEASEVLDSIWWVGLTEYMKESMCILAYQMGQFDPVACNCQTTKGLDVTGTNGWKRKKNVAGGYYTVHHLNLISTVNRDDLLLHGLAVKRFFNDVAAIKKATGISILC